MTKSTSNKGRRYFQLGLGVALSAICLYFALRGENWAAIGQELGRANYLYLVPMVPLGFYILYVRAQRWKVILDLASGARQPIMPIFSASAIGFMANMVLPLRVGEFARPYLVSRHTGIPLSTALATVVVERVLDLLVLFVFAVGVVLFSDVPQLVKQLAWMAGAVTAVSMGAAVVVSAQRE